jgi:hypothetical protein
MTALVSAQQYFSKAVHCSVSGAIIRKVGAVPRNKACAGTDVSDAVSAQRRVPTKQFRLSKTGLLQRRTNATSAADAWMPVWPERERLLGVR